MSARNELLESEISKCNGRTIKLDATKFRHVAAIAWLDKDTSPATFWYKNVEYVASCLYNSEFMVGYRVVDLSLYKGSVEPRSLSEFWVAVAYRLRDRSNLQGVWVQMGKRKIILREPWVIVKDGTEVEQLSIF